MRVIAGVSEALTDELGETVLAMLADELALAMLLNGIDYCTREVQRL